MLKLVNTSANIQHPTSLASLLEFKAIGKQKKPGAKAHRAKGGLYEENYCLIGLSLA